MWWWILLGWVVWYASAFLYLMYRFSQDSYTSSYLLDILSNTSFYDWFFERDKEHLLLLVYLNIGLFAIWDHRHGKHMVRMKIDRAYARKHKLRHFIK